MKNDERKARRIILALLRAIEAKDALLVCHRLGRHPSNKLFDNLQKVEKAVKQAKEFLER